LTVCQRKFQLIQIIEADLFDCMIALPPQLFYATGIPACLWFLARNKRDPRFRDRRGEALFIDARKMGLLIDRVHRDLADEEIARIAETYHAWRGEQDAGVYKDAPGFCKSATREEIESHGYVLTPGRYVAADALEVDDQPFEEVLGRLRAELQEQFVRSRELEAAIRRNLDMVLE
jgi:type I restriction enzyme M protein